jgi:hypothetical protein
MSRAFHDEIVHHRYEDMRRNELNAQLAALVRLEQEHASPFARGRALFARLPHPHRARSPREAYV